MRNILKYWLCVYSLPRQSFAVRSFQTHTSLSGSFGRPRTENWAARVVQGLSEIERSLLLRELTKYKCPPTQGIDVTATGGVSRPVSSSHTRLVFFANGLPFIGFGFLDNFIMIVAGEYIDLTFASVFSLSTMAAAGLGNWISDLCGIGTVGYVERFAAKLGFVIPRMTQEQSESSRIQWATVLGRAAGISLGCFLGMLPLLWFDRRPLPGASPDS
ncbi:hypothetical protein PHET_05977 [Paragonimus heterotremus]|uniref:Transmembrane protein 65 n=1 Tax=Paragonimus heterotremus TaxID=100268 RepID=A0A8J4SKJ5_9TREM|nr:hypothetical protein PHET_05977 [Paragonimus heterotremus]